MCKNADNPCPGCKKHKTGDVRWMFFTEEGRLVLERLVRERRNKTGPSSAEANAHS